MEFDTAFDGAQAVEMVKQKDYDLVLMDLQMPILDGFRAASIIRELPGEKYKELPIIALTAASEQYYHERIQEAGFSDFVNKPFQAEDLLRKITRYGRRRVENSAGV